MKQKPSSRVARMIAVLVIGSVSLLGWTGGCASSDDPATRPSSSDQALEDPMNFDPAADMRSVSGNRGSWRMDKKAMKEDLNSAFNP